MTPFKINKKLNNAEDLYFSAIYCRYVMYSWKHYSWPAWQCPAMACLQCISFSATFVGHFLHPRINNMNNVSLAFSFFWSSASSLTVSFHLRSPESHSHPPMPVGAAGAAPGYPMEALPTLHQDIDSSLPLDVAVCQQMIRQLRQDNQRKEHEVRIMFSSGYV